MNVQDCLVLQFVFTLSAPDIPLYRVDPVQDKHTELQIRVLYENCYSKDGGKPTSYQLMYKQFTGESTDIQCPEG